MAIPAEHRVTGDLCTLATSPVGALDEAEALLVVLLGEFGVSGGLAPQSVVTGVPHALARRIPVCEKRTERRHDDPVVLDPGSHVIVESCIAQISKWPFNSPRLQYSVKIVFDLKK